MAIAKPNVKFATVSAKPPVKPAVSMHPTQEKAHNWHRVGVTSVPPRKRGE